MRTFVRMNVLIIVATEGEIGPFLRLPEWQRRGTDVLVTGVGMVATAFALGKKLATHRYDLLLNIGIAGSFDRSIPLGDVVCVYQDTFAELGAEDGGDFLDSDRLGLGQPTFEGLHQGYPALNNLLKCRGITVNKVHGNDVRSQKSCNDWTLKRKAWKERRYSTAHINWGSRPSRCVLFQITLNAATKPTGKFRGLSKISTAGYGHFSTSSGV